MLKITGVIFCVTGCCGYGLLKIASWNLALKEINQWILLFEKMKSHIRYQRDPLEDICCLMRQDIYGIGGAYVANAGEKAKKQRGSGFEAIWKQEMNQWKKESMLSKEIKELIIRFTDYTGEQDYELQMNFLDLFISNLVREKNAMEKQIQEKKKPVMAISLSGGIMVSLILL